MSLPFHSFADKPEPPPPVVKESIKPQEIPNIDEPATVSKPENDIIMLESDSDVEVENEDEKPADSVPSVAGNVENGEGKTEDENDNVVLLDSDYCSDGEEKDGNMSLTDLSSSFQKIVQTADEKRKSNEGVEFGSGGFAEVIPFDYAAARKDAKFGEEGSDGESGGEDGIKNRRESKKKSAAGGRKNAAGERSGDFQLGKRRQAFPATGNRSSTFR